ncbi:dihydrolipoamide acetyltransferase family protein [Nocardia wallacei]|uniref:Dihydrolipoamide acetyltransferase component of pyruvate dehydrogenase complex n=1 Tax=Nocardia wallacei TaxID=480035 RepID=A0A7G1KQD2_9NOCA|nr:dihydrolipoamide acetyltransferase family protein [Nocardia wallacei]BCK57485.1 dihydrolipoamide acetyltransferase component of pyruvate dehydrogenase complex [Nocardia wallacei]
MPEITMPRLSDTMEDGVIASWLKQVGDQVTRGEVLAEIETDKALMELEAYDDGVLEQILADAGARVPIGEPIAIVGDGTGPRTTAGAQAVPGASAPAAPAVEASGSASRASAVQTGGSSSAEEPKPGQRPKSSPLARKIARELGVDLAAVTGTGPGGRITRRDVESARAAGVSAPRTGAEAVVGDTAYDSGPGGRSTAPAHTEPAEATGTVGGAPASGDHDEVPLTTIQQVSAKRLAESMRQAPHIYLTSAIDVTELFTFRGRINATLEAAGKGKVSVNDLLVKAVASTLRADPAVNVSFAGDKLVRHHGIHLGVAVATPAGLLVPVLRDADRKSVSEIAAETRELAGRARDRKLRANEMSGGTFTISNLGMFGIEQFTAVINPPESAILAVGAAQDEVRLADGEVVARKILRVTLSADHRAIDGAVAAQFLQHLKELLEHPLRIIT